MVIILGVSAKKIKDTRGEDTIEVTIKTDIGKFSASSPNGKSKGKKEAKPYKKTIDDDIKTLDAFSGYFSKEILEKFRDLHRIEDIIKDSVGANTLFALESATLKAISKEKKIPVWKIINPRAKKFPIFIGNCIEGGVHVNKEKKPDFQEFLLIPKGNNPKENSEINKEIFKRLKFILSKNDPSFKEKIGDENGWVTSLNDREVLEILKDEKKVRLGVDVAASTYYKRKKYHYNNPKLARTPEEHMNYISNIIKNENLFYIEDPFEEESFESFSNLLKKFPDRLIVGDDLTVTSLKRLKMAIEKKSINAIIVKPNQNGSLIEVEEVCKLARDHKIKIIFSHRSGETEENILADLAFGFQADYLKCGIYGKGRESKIKRLIEISKEIRG